MKLKVRSTTLTVRGYRTSRRKSVVTVEQLKDLDPYVDRSEEFTFERDLAKNRKSKKIAETRVRAISGDPRTKRIQENQSHNLLKSQVCFMTFTVFLQNHY